MQRTPIPPIPVIPFANSPGQLNGEVLAGGGCKCDVGWTGATCADLDLDPEAVVLYGTGSDAAADTSSWGGGPPAYDPATGKYHLFVSELAGNCGMGTWDRGSQAAHAVSSSELGPYKRVDLAIGTETHNTLYVRVP